MNSDNELDHATTTSQAGVIVYTYNSNFLLRPSWWYFPLLGVCRKMRENWRGSPKRLHDSAWVVHGALREISQRPPGQSRWDGSTVIVFQWPEQVRLDRQPLGLQTPQTAPAQRKQDQHFIPSIYMYLGILTCCCGGGASIRRQYKAFSSKRQDASVCVGGGLQSMAPSLHQHVCQSLFGNFAHTICCMQQRT